MRTDWTRYFRIGLSQCKRGDDVATVAAAAAFADAALAEQQKREAEARDWITRFDHHTQRGGG